MMTEKQRKCLTNPHFYCDGEITSGNYTLRNSAMQIVRLMVGWDEINMMMNVFVACLIYEGQQGCILTIYVFYKRWTSFWFMNHSIEIKNQCIEL